MKRLLATLLTVCLLMSMFAIPAGAEELSGTIRF